MKGIIDTLAFMIRSQTELYDIDVEECLSMFLSQPDDFEIMFSLLTWNYSMNINDKERVRKKVFFLGEEK